MDPAMIRLCTCMGGFFALFLLQVNLFSFVRDYMGEMHFILILN